MGKKFTTERFEATKKLVEEGRIPVDNSKCNCPERWHSIEERNNEYWVSSKGRILSFNGTILINGLNADGYVQLTSRRRKYHGIHVTKRVHVLVAKYFIPNPLNKDTVDHRDPDEKEHNCVCNLQWLTRGENASKDHALGRREHCPKRGEKNPLSKLTESDILSIRKAFENPYRGLGAALAREYGVTHTLITNIKKNKTWKHI